MAEKEKNEKEKDNLLEGRNVNVYLKNEEQNEDEVVISLSAIMRKLKKEGKLSAVFVSHDIALVSTICDRIMVMKDGRCVEQSETAEVIRAPKDSYTKQLIESAGKQSIG